MTDIVSVVFEGGADQPQPVRIVMVEGVPWFIATDLARVLGYRDADKAVRILDDDEKGTRIVGTPGGVQPHVMVTESGLYHLIFRSRKDTAAHFRRWVTGEVLPAIRKNGAYGPPSRSLAPIGPTMPPAERVVWPLPSVREAHLHKHDQSVLMVARHIATNGIGPRPPNVPEEIGLWREVAQMTGLSAENVRRSLSLLDAVGLFIIADHDRWFRSRPYDRFDPRPQR